MTRVKKIEATVCKYNSATGLLQVFHNCEQLFVAYNLVQGISPNGAGPFAVLPCGSLTAGEL